MSASVGLWAPPMHTEPFCLLPAANVCSSGAGGSLSHPEQNCTAWERQAGSSGELTSPGVALHPLISLEQSAPSPLRWDNSEAHVWHLFSEFPSRTESPPHTYSRLTNSALISCLLLCISLPYFSNSGPYASQINSLHPVLASGSASGAPSNFRNASVRVQVQKENPPQVVQMKTLQCKRCLRIKEANMVRPTGPRTAWSLYCP